MLAYFSHLRPKLKSASLPFWFSVLALNSCGGASAQTQIGTSNEVMADSEAHLDLDAVSAKSEGASDEKAEHGDKAPPAPHDDAVGSESDAAQVEELKLAALARAALRTANPPENHLGLTFAISQRASDLHWVLAIENRSAHGVRLASLPELLHFELLPPEAPDAEASEKTRKKGPKTITCGGDSLPKSVADSETAELSAGELIYYSFDPRDLCKDESALRAGVTVKATFGFPIKTKKVWKSGKLEEVERAQKAPFVAQRSAEEGEEFVPLKKLVANEFVLGPTYPLEELSPFAPNSRETEQNDSSRTASATGASTAPPRPPLSLVISPLGTSGTPKKKDVSVRLVNRSSSSIKVFVRRELITYEVTGPKSSFTCRMHPADRHPLPSEFIRLGAGSSTSLKTRLAEACPPDAWEAPGTYLVSARFDAKASGEEFGLKAFMGSAVTAKPARLTVPGDAKDAKPKMKIATAQPPR